MAKSPDEFSEKEAQERFEAMRAQNLPQAAEGKAEGGKGSDTKATKQKPA